MRKRFMDTSCCERSREYEAMDAEEWRVVPNFPKYEASSIGRVRSNAVNGKNRVLKAALCGKGPAKYWYVSLSGDHRPFTRVVHQLVLEAFVGPRPKDAVSRHLDGYRLNCRLSNLTWGTPKENMADRRKHGHGNNGEGNPKAKLTLAQVSEIRSRALTKAEIRELATQLGVRVGTIQNILSWKSWR
ncbi:MAG: HNH endonuclease signature motif containing protein [Acidobacteriota bacterium]